MAMEEAVRLQQTSFNMNEIIEVQQAEMLQAINKSEIDMQIATAKQYPRNVNHSLAIIQQYATMDAETAADCFYAVARGDKTVEGLSVRMAEIIAGAWGNLRVATRIIGNDGKTITAQGVCHDLETNVAVSVEVKRRITDKYGKTYSEDMQVVTGNAAAAIAYRNAVLKVVPKAVTKSVIDKVRSLAMPSDKEIAKIKAQMFDWFKKKGVSEEAILFYCKVSNANEINNEKVFELRGLANAINEGATTVEESFIKPLEQAKKRKEAAAKAGTAEGKAAAAIAAASGAAPVPENVDPETGEVKEKEAAPAKQTTTSK